MRASEPVARTIFLAFTVCDLPSASFTSMVCTPSFAGPVSLPKPLKVVILFFFIRKARPLVWRVITSSLRASTFFQLSFGSATSMPNFSACFRWSQISAVKSIALVGMHPQSRQVPPRRSFASISAALRPYCEARMAQVYPAGPPPTTTTSKIVSANGNSNPGENVATFQFYAGRQHLALMPKSSPQARQRGCEKALAKGGRFLAVIEHQPQFEIVAAGIRQFPKPFEIVRIHGSARFDFNAHHSAAAIFDDKVDLVLIFVPIVIQSAGTLHPGKLFQHLRINERLQQAPEDSTVLRNLS